MGQDKPPIDDALLRLHDAASAYAVSVNNDRLPGYWYAPDYFRRPHEAAEKLFPKEMALSYATLSSAAHGGLFGLGVFRDQPDTVHPNVRDDPRAQTLALCTSIRIVLEQAHARDQFELGGQLSHIYASLIKQLSKVPSAYDPPNFVDSLNPKSR